MTNLNDVLLAMSNIPVDDPIAEIWGRGLQGGGYTIIEYTGALPITFKANGDPLIDYWIYGNTVQNGTPTPENPILPIGCGERVDITGLSEPLCGIGTYTDSLDLSTGMLTRRIKKFVLDGTDGELTISGKYRILITDQLKGIVPICTHYRGSDVIAYANLQDGCVSVSIQSYLTIYDSRFTTIDGVKEYLAAQYAAGTPVIVWYVLAEPEVSTILVPSGMTGIIEGYTIQDGTPTPETPIYPTTNGVKQADDTYAIHYGYKLPILSNSTVTNIYLGEMETTRWIKKLVLTGEEDYRLQSINTYGIANFYFYLRTNTPYAICTHLKKQTTVISQTTDEGYLFALGSSGSLNASFYMRISSSTESPVEELKSFLAAQYAAGTPVTVWYVLAEPETGIVNEPLMKIGNYADTVSMEQAGVSIPTNNGSTVIDYDGATKPSQMYIKYLGVKK